MSPEKQRIAIAVFCGWKKNREVDPGYFVWINPDGKMRGQDALPDYVNDLNAIHEAEKRLNATQCEQYNESLYSAEPNEHDCDASGWGFHRNAAQRAEIILRTIGKGEESS